MNFDKIVDRYNTDSIKYDFMTENNMPADVFPMWVADMDFECCDEILNALRKKIEHGVFGYTKNGSSYFNAVKNWYHDNFNVDLKQEWLITTPGVVFALATAVKALTDAGDYVLINNPVYYPFTNVVENNGRKIISSDLMLKNGHYEIDFDDFENKIKAYKIKLYLLCSPHNPVGRVWTKNELDEIVKICRRNNVLIVSDEIHSDFVWNRRHINLLSYIDFRDSVVLCTAPSKTFNLAGLQVANIFIPNEKIREKFQSEIRNTGYSSLNSTGMTACQAAYEYGQKWLDELKRYLMENINYVDEFLKEKLPKIKLIYPEGTYLLWLDFHELNLSDNEIEDIMVNRAKLWLDNGNMFGEAGRGFQRINIALPKEKLKNALNNLETAFKDF